MSLPSDRNAVARSTADASAHACREWAVRVGEFRRTAVLVPVDEHDVPLTADLGGVRWIYAFSDETALARYALARGAGDREWAYQRWLGARLLDAAVPAVGVPCGIALDVGGPGTLFPPLAGIVPDRVAVDVAEERGAAG
ncbi:SseB family protein [Streptomyces incarnatus]